MGFGEIMLRLFDPGWEKKELALRLEQRLRGGVLMTGRSLITGGDAADRSDLMALAAAQAGGRENRVVVLHRREPRVSAAMCTQAGFANEELAYDPLAGTSPGDGALLLSRCAEACGLDGGSMYLLLEDILFWLRDHGGEELGIWGLLSRDGRSWNRLLMEDEDHFLDSHVSEKTVTELSGFLSRLRQAFPSCSLPRVSLSSPGRRKLCLSLGQSQLCWRLALLELIRLHETEESLCVILESPPSDPALTELVGQSWHGPMMLCGSDLPAMGESWGQLSGDLAALIAFRHGSGGSCDTLAQYFGQCERTRIDRTAGTAKNNTALLTRTNTSGYTARTVREYAIQPERIQRLDRGCAVVQLRGMEPAVCALIKHTGGHDL